ncbi:MAG TPA: histidine kinase dimerization/phospho-acceptor domain-containing protein [Actinospica sp.]|nr:histidine kinase dimerization/phospho-acceptor domain-containing protein [Actinospica sp.]
MEGDDRWGEAGGTGLAANATQARAARALVEALSPLDARTAALLRALAHQLRNPLTAALGYLELLDDGSLGPLTAEQQRVLKVVADGMFRLAELVEELEPGASAGRG